MRRIADWITIWGFLAGFVSNACTESPSTGSEKPVQDAIASEVVSDALVTGDADGDVDGATDASGDIGDVAKADGADAIEPVDAEVDAAPDVGVDARGAVDSEADSSLDAGDSSLGAGDSPENDAAVQREPDAEVDVVPSSCPPEMALAGSACIDRWEAHIADWSPYEVPTGGSAASAPGVVPQGYVSGDVAALACQNAGKRLCTLDEWMRACQGMDGWTWPYGDVYVTGACNDTYPGGHPVIDYFGTATGVWDAAHLNDPGINQQQDSVDLTGANAGCVTPEGVFDLHGNLHEWIDDAEGTFKGGFYVDGSINGAGCSYTTTAHASSYHDYSTGFRCCKDPL